MTPGAVRFRHGLLTAEIHRAPGLGQPEVEQLGARLRQHDVARLQIAVDDAGTMRAIERGCDLRCTGERLVERQCAARQARGEGLALEVLHHQEAHAILSAHVVQRADVRMAQGADRTRLALEPLVRLGIDRRVDGEGLDRHGAIETRIDRLVDIAHASPANLRGDRVGTYASMGQRSGDRKVRKRLCDRRLEEAGGPLVGREQAFDLPTKVLVAGTGFEEVGRTGLARQRSRGLEHLLDSLPAFGAHGHSVEILMQKGPER